MNEGGFLKRAFSVVCGMAGVLEVDQAGFDAAVSSSLAMVGGLLSASRVYVMMNEVGGKRYRSTHEWMDGVTAPVLDMRAVYEYEADTPSLPAMLSDRQVVTKRTREAPADLQDFLAGRGAKSVAWTPLRRDGVRIGFVGAECCADERDWGDEERSVLRLFADLLVLAMDRLEMLSLRSNIRDALTALGEGEALAARPEGGLPAIDGPMTLREAERRLIVQTLESHNGNKLRAAKQLGLTWPALDRRCKKLGIDVKRR